MFLTRFCHTLKLLVSLYNQFTTSVGWIKDSDFSLCAELSIGTVSNCQVE